MKEEYSLGYMIRLYSWKEYFLRWDFLIALVFSLLCIFVLVTSGPALSEAVSTTFGALISLTGVLLGVLIGAMAIVVSFMTEDFLRFIKAPQKGKPPLYSKILFHFVWPTIWLSASIMTSFLGQVMLYSQVISVEWMAILAVFSLGSGIYGLGNAVKAVFSVTYLAILRGRYVETKKED